MHLTETCGATIPYLMTGVKTTLATTNDVQLTGTIDQILATRQLLPQSHLVGCRLHQS
jgi:hypothetical protein